MRVNWSTRFVVVCLTVTPVILTIVLGLGYYFFRCGQRSRDIDVLGREAVVLASEGKFDVAANYLSLGGSPNVADRLGFSLSFYAVTFGEHAILRKLVSRGADVRRVPAGFEDLMLEAIGNQDLTSVCILAGSGQWSEADASLLDRYLDRARLHSDEFANGVKQGFKSSSSQPNRNWTLQGPKSKRPSDVHKPQIKRSLKVGK